MTPYVRYDYFDSNTEKTVDETQGPVMGLVWRPYMYGRFVGEYTLSQASAKNTNKFSIEAQYMF